MDMWGYIFIIIHTIRIFVHLTTLIPIVQQQKWTLG